MCGIVGAVAQREVSPILLEGLRRLEYRGYDSAGIAVLTDQAQVERVRRPGKVAELAAALLETPVHGQTGIAHTRWATHGKPSTSNAHPHICKGDVAVVHNGIIENYEQLKSDQLEQDFQFTSETDTEVIVHLIYHYMQTHSDLLQAVRHCVADLRGAFALGVISPKDPHRLIAARRGSPLVIGIGIGEHFIASDIPALLPVTQQFIFLEEGDIADITPDRLVIYDVNGHVVEREVRRSDLQLSATDRGTYRHFMLKEIFEQPRAIMETLEGRLGEESISDEIFGPQAAEVFARTKQVQIVACGTSFHAGLIARYWFESLAGISCNVEVASEFRYRQPVVQADTLFVCISQSGETADTLAALRESAKRPYSGTLSICNVAESSLVREAQLSLMTRAGPEIGVASTKAFTTQLVALMMLVISLGQHHGLKKKLALALIEQLRSLPTKVEQVLGLDEKIEALAERFADKHHALFLGRGAQYPVAMEGALKLKEISYIHAEAYPAGELKHGPLALVDADMPVIAVAPNNELLEKLKANLEEVNARGGELFVFADRGVNLPNTTNVTVFEVAATEDPIAPIVFTVPLQLLSYHVAVLKGTDVDQPRNLAKSVTVE